MDPSELIEHYKHKHESDPMFSKGSSLFKHVPYLARVVKDHRVKTLLDYGCGKAFFWKWSYSNAILDTETLHKTMYDPAVKGRDILPKGRYDLVVCTDVLEHLHPADTNEVVKRLIRYTRRHLFCCIALTEAKKTFPDGTNLHTNIHTQEWWEELFEKEVNDYESKYGSYISYKLSFNDEVFT